MKTWEHKGDLITVPDDCDIKITHPKSIEPLQAKAIAIQAVRSPHDLERVFHVDHNGKNYTVEIEKHIPHWVTIYGETPPPSPSYCLECGGVGIVSGVVCNECKGMGK